MRKGYRLPSFPFGLKANELEWEDERLPASQVKAMRARLEKANTSFVKEAEARLAKVQRSIEADRVWLAEERLRAKEQLELIDAVAAMYEPLFSKPKDRRRVPKRIAARAVGRIF